MYNSYEVTLVLSLMIYGLFFNTKLLVVFFGVAVAYHLLGFLATRNELSKQSWFTPSWQKSMNIANTDPPRDSHCLSSFPIDMDKIKAWLEKVNKRSGRKGTDNEIKANHIFLKMIAAVMKS